MGNTGGGTRLIAPESGRPTPGPPYIGFDDSDGDADMLGEDALTGTGEVCTAPPATEEVTAPPAQFVAAKKFDGPCSGMVFRIGDRGLGYYKDQRATHIELDALLRPDPVRIGVKLDDLVYSGRLAADPHHIVEMQRAVDWLVRECTRKAAGRLATHRLGNDDYSSKKEGTEEVGSTEDRGSKEAGSDEAGTPPRKRRKGDGSSGSSDSNCVAISRGTQDVADDGSGRLATSTANGTGDGLTTRPSRKRGKRGGPGDPKCTGDGRILTGSETPQPTASDASFRRHAVWAVDTANPGHWTPAKQYITHTAADLCLVQETKVRPGLPHAEAEQSVKGIHWKAAIGPGNVTAKDGLKAGVAVAARAHIGMADAGGNHGDTSRCTVKHCSIIIRGGVNVGPVYLHCTVGVGNPGNLAILHDLGEQLMEGGRPFIVGGDWQGPPETLAETGWLDVVDGFVVRPALPTCNGRCLDYFVVSRGIAHLVHDVLPVADPPWNTGASAQHAPVRLLIDSSRRQTRVRRVRAPNGFPAALPHGPPPKESDSLRRKKRRALDLATGAHAVDNQVGEAYRIAIGIIEEQLSAISGHDKKERSLHGGRAGGPSLTWAQAGAQDARRRGNTTAVSRAWGLAHTWMHTVCTSTNPRCKRAANTKLRRYKHQPPKWGAEFEDRDAEWYAFERWLELVRRADLHNGTWTNAARIVASSAHQRATDTARRLARIRWHNWMHEGPAAGLSRQHRFTKTAVGWTRTEVAVPAPTTTGEFDDTSGPCQAMAHRAATRGPASCTAREQEAG